MFQGAAENIRPVAIASWFDNEKLFTRGTPRNRQTVRTGSNQDVAPKCLCTLLRAVRRWWRHTASQNWATPMPDTRLAAHTITACCVTTVAGGHNDRHPANSSSLTRLVPRHRTRVKQYWPTVLPVTFPHVDQFKNSFTTDSIMQ